MTQDTGTISAPEPTTTEPAGRGRSLRLRGGDRRRWLIALLALVIAIVAVGLTATKVLGAAGAQTTGYAQAADSRVLNFPVTAELKSVDVQPGQTVTKGQVLATLDTASALAKLEAAKATLSADQARLAQLTEPLPTDEQAKADKLVDQASTQAASARSQLGVMNSSYAASLAAAQEKVRAAQNNVKLAQKAYDDCLKCSPCSGHSSSGSDPVTTPSTTPAAAAAAATPGTSATTATASASTSDSASTTSGCPARLTALETAKNRLAMAEADLKQLMAAHNVNLSRASAAVDTAQAHLALVVANSQAGQDVDPIDLAAAQAQVKKDEASVASAQQEADGTSLVAPFAGVIGSVGGTAGELATPDGLRDYTDQSSQAIQRSGGLQVLPKASTTSQTATQTYEPLIVIYSTQMELVAQVGENQVNDIQPGDDATGTVPALPGREFTLKVVRTDPAPVRVDDQVFYLVHLRIEPGTGHASTTGLLSGMTANVTFR